MPSQSKVYIAGVGCSPSPPEGPPVKAVLRSLVSAATKALLDAGVTYDDITQCVRSKTLSYASEVFKALDERESPVDDVEGGSELDSSIRWVRDQGAQCVLMIAVEKSAAAAFVLVSENFLWRHPYLRDSAALVREAGSLQSKSQVQARQGLYDLCKIVWSMRGWSEPQGTAAREGRVLYKAESGQSFELSRADARAIPEWKEVEHKQDGKHRLKYNPARETKEISQEDFEAMRASGTRHNEAYESIQFDRKGGDRAALGRL